MQTRKKMTTKSSSPRYCIQPRKMAVISERKVNELILSAKKKKPGKIDSKINPDHGRESNAVEDFVEVFSDDISVAYQASVDDNGIGETIFSPSFFNPKHTYGSISMKVDFLDTFAKKDAVQPIGKDLRTGNLASVDDTSAKETYGIDKMEIAPMQTDGNSMNAAANSCIHSVMEDNTGCSLHIESYHDKSIFEDDFSSIGDLSPEVSAIYLAMQNSKLECADERSQASIPDEVCVEPDDDDFDDFDPYLFIKDLPDLSLVVPKFRRVLLPKQTRSCPPTTLVLDLDETLVHSTLEPCKDADFAFPVNFNFKEHTIYVRCRPFLKDFMEKVSTLFETIIFTASQSIYAEQLLNMLDPKRKLFRHRVFRESCVYVEGNYLKDLSVLGRDLAHVVIVDNSPQAFGFQLDNGIPIESWFDDRTDRELLSLLPFLESLVGVEDVRPLIAKKFNLRQKVEAAAPFS
ncbi:hypothetical protein HPP92_003171 [Vanilla planifolia]|uniref:FCP1 homology domain-containing protein n=1 Tax=Vanilla planifolia TaxID=51239 RepID=A0A835S7M3_VANPL|nr:hypothetical protein HPP92_003171 [Vanilla planifolia]